MSHLIPVDGAQEGGGQVLRTALALSAATGQGFEITKIGAGRLQPGLRPQHTAAVRAAALTCRARISGVFDGSPDLRFEPGSVEPGEFRFEIAGAGAVTLLLQTVLLPLATAPSPSVVEVTGGTHVPASPSFHYLARHWSSAVAQAGLSIEATLLRAGYHPAGGGEVRAEVRPWVRPRSLDLTERGALVSVRGLAGASRLKLAVAERLRDAAHEVLWEQRRLEAGWEVLEVPGASPGAFILLEAVFEKSRAAYSFIAERGTRPETLGARAARTLLHFLEADGAVDSQLADQLAVPLALAGGGGAVTTDQVGRDLERVAEVVSSFGIPARAWGRRGGPGGLEVGR